MVEGIEINVFVDKDFAWNYFEVENSSASVSEDFENKFLKSNSKKTLFSNFKNEEEFFATAQDNPLLEALIESIPKLELCEWNDKAEFIRISASYPGFKIFFIDLPDDTCQQLSFETGYLVINAGNIYAQWEKYIEKTHYKDLDLPSDSADEFAFKSWDDLNFISHSPSSNIIIQDNYILSDRNARISENLLPLIEAILPVGMSKEVDILIISSIKEDGKGKPLKEKAIEIHRFLNSRLAKYKEIKLNISLVYHHKSFNPSDNPDFHDRHIYTNYYTLNCGAGFNLFQNKKRIQANSEIAINFNFQPRQMRILPRRLKSIVRYIEKLKKMDSLEGFKYYPEIRCSIIGYT